MGKGDRDGGREAIAHWLLGIDAPVAMVTNVYARCSLIRPTIGCVLTKPQTFFRILRTTTTTTVHNINKKNNVRSD